MKKTASALIWLGLALSIGLTGCIGNHLPTYPDSDDEGQGPGERDPNAMIAPNALEPLETVPGIRLA